MAVKSKNTNTLVKHLSLQTLKALDFSLNGNKTLAELNLSVNHLKTQSLAKRIDQLEAFLVKNFEPIECPLEHVFTPGLYTRTITMPAGSCVTSKIHKTMHQFIISEGSCTVFNGDEKGVKMKAGDKGITEPGTRRRLLIHETTVWTTIHPTDKTTVEEVEEDIIEKHVNEFLVSDNQSNQNKKQLWHGQQLQLV